MESGAIAIERGLAPVTFAVDHIHAEELRTLLEVGGIASVIGAESDTGGLFGIPVLVGDDELERAGEIVSAHAVQGPRNEDDDDWVDDDDDDDDDDDLDDDLDDDDFYLDDDDDDDDDDLDDADEEI